MLKQIRVGDIKITDRGKRVNIERDKKKIEKLVDHYTKISWNSIKYIKINEKDELVDGYLRLMCMKEILGGDDKEITVEVITT